MYVSIGVPGGGNPGCGVPLLTSLHMCMSAGVPGGGNPGLAAIWREERARRRQAGDGRDSQPTPEPQESRPAPRQPTEIAALAAMAARLADQSQSQVRRHAPDWR